MASISSSKSDHDLPRWGPSICLNSSCVSFQGFKLNLPQHLLKVNPEFINPGWFIGMCLNQWHDVQVPFWKHLENILKQRSVQQKKSCPSLERWNSQCHPLDSAQHAPHPVVCCQMEPAWGGSGGVLRGSVKKNEAWNKGIFWNCRFPKKNKTTWPPLSVWWGWLEAPYIQGRAFASRGAKEMIHQLNQMLPIFVGDQPGRNCELPSSSMVNCPCANGPLSISYVRSPEGTNLLP